MASVSAFEADAGRVGDVSAARPYLEALFGVGCTLRQLDRHEKAAETFRQLLQLDDDDHQFARYWLAACLL